ncbi:MAG: DsbA family protein [Propionibacteriaceae bacterium]|jgi:protein-disulfide isomerase|nr:DsbA family protein [Propionibacteriaceae bacterium]
MNENESTPELDRLRAAADSRDDQLHRSATWSAAMRKARGITPSVIRADGSLAPTADQKRNRWIAVILVVIILAATIPAVIVQLNRSGDDSSNVASNGDANHQAEPGEMKDGVPPHATEDRAGIWITDDDGRGAVAGLTSDLPHLTVYIDPQCPHCATWDEAFSPVIAEAVNAGTAVVDYRLRSFLDVNLQNDSSHRAGVAASCADGAGPGFFQRFVDAMLAHQPAMMGMGFTDEVLRETIPAEIGLTGAALDTFQSCFDTMETSAFVDGVEEIARTTAFNGTPTYVMNDASINTQITDEMSAPDPDKLRALLGL